MEFVLNLARKSPHFWNYWTVARILVTAISMRCKSSLCSSSPTTGTDKPNRNRMTRSGVQLHPVSRKHNLQIVHSWKLFFFEFRPCLTLQLARPMVTNVISRTGPKSPILKAFGFLLSLTCLERFACHFHIYFRSPFPPFWI